MMRAGLALFVLLLPVVGCAEIISDGCNMCRKSSGSDLIECTAVYCPPPKTHEDVCHQRMREAMREATLFINQKAGRVIYEKNGKMWVVPDPALVDEWNAVMRDCVKGE